MPVTAQDLVRREVHYCVSSLVSTLAANYGDCTPTSLSGGREMYQLLDQAFELAAPIDDWESAARDAGWNGRTVDGTFWNSLDNEVIDDASIETYRDLCEELDIEPYQREVFEFWIVSDWLADKLIEKGEKVDKDFAGMTVWARTTTGQAIYADHVFEEIAAELTR